MNKELCMQRCVSIDKARIRANASTLFSIDLILMHKFGSFMVFAPTFEQRRIHREIRVLLKPISEMIFDYDP